MRGLRLWEFLTGDIPCPPPLVVPVRPTIPDNAADAVRTKLLDDYDASMESYASQFAAYRTWLDEDARAGAVLAASMEEQISADIVGFEHAHQMWAFLRERYEPTGQSTYIAALRQEQLLRQGDLQLISMLRCLQCGVSLILLVLHYHPALVTRVRLRRLLWRLGALTTF